jgi:membrane protease YdiL (CAAX protease family)
MFDWWKRGNRSRSISSRHRCVALIRRSCLVTLIGVFLFVAEASNKHAQNKPPSVKERPWPDVSLTLQTKGKRTEAERKLIDCKSAGDSMFREKRYEAAIEQYQQCIAIDPNDFQANLYLGYSFYDVRRYEDAAKILRKARGLNPEDFDANLWLGISLTRARSLKEAVVNLEKAYELRPDSQLARRELLLAYLAGGQPEKAGHVYPEVVRVIGGVLLVIYGVWLGALLPFSLPIRDKLFPGFWFSLSWLGLFFEGQIAFLFILASLPWLGLHETVLCGTIVAALPIIAVALTGFARQPWGEPFRWPFRFGCSKIILISILLVFAIILSTVAFAQLYSFLTNRPFPIQPIIPLIRSALEANAVVAWLAIALVIPCVEEIFFRGLLFGAFQKMWGITGAVLGSSLVFVCAHVQVVGSFALFCLGLTLAWARLRSRSLGLPIVLHGLNNAIAMAVITFVPHSGT